MEKTLIFPKSKNEDFLIFLFSHQKQKWSDFYQLPKIKLKLENKSQETQYINEMKNETKQNSFQI